MAPTQFGFRVLAPTHLYPSQQACCEWLPCPYPSGHQGNIDICFPSHLTRPPHCQGHSSRATGGNPSLSGGGREDVHHSATFERASVIHPGKNPGKNIRLTLTGRDTANRSQPAASGTVGSAPQPGTRTGSAPIREPGRKIPAPPAGNAGTGGNVQPAVPGSICRRHRSR